MMSPPLPPVPVLTPCPARPGKAMHAMVHPPHTEEFVNRQVWAL